MSFALGSPLGLELEYDQSQHALVVFDCKAGGQAAAAGVTQGAVVVAVHPGPGVCRPCYCLCDPE